MVLKGLKRLPSLRATAIWVLVMIALPTMVQSAKENFDRSKPHVNISSIGGGTGSGLGSLLDGGWFTGTPAVAWSLAADGTLVPDPVTFQRVYNKRQFSEAELKQRSSIDFYLTINSAGNGACVEAYELQGCVPTRSRIIIDNVGDQGALEELTFQCKTIVLSECP